MVSASSGAGRKAVSVWFSGPRSVDLRESIARPPGPGEVLIEALYSAISHGTEMLVFRGEVPADLALDLSIPTCQGSFDFPVKYGYASVGRVAEVHSDAASLKTGDVVFAFNPHETCYTIPAGFVTKLPDELAPKSGVFVANLETAVNAMLDAAPRLGETVAVIGQGVVGLLITWLARKVGAGLVITADPLEVRQRLSQALGADWAVDSSARDIADRVAELTDGVGADVVIEASGQPSALDSAIRACSREGRVVVVSWYGVKRASLLLGADFHRKRLTLRSSQVSTLDPSLGPRWTLSRRRELVVRYLAEIDFEPLITHTIPFARAAEAYRMIDEQPEQVVQVVLEYNR
jgi:2-desacetyl-2-hydroxyethyl bacteriochlorophyllide A dehydrogenase